jgi:hypothetical protein
MSVKREIYLILLLFGNSFYHGISCSSRKNFPVIPLLSKVANFTIGLAPCSTVFIPLYWFSQVAV